MDLMAFWNRRTPTPEEPRLLGGDASARFGFSEWVQEVFYSFNGNGYLLPTTQAPFNTEAIETDFDSMVGRVYKASPAVFAVMQRRASLLGEARFCYRTLDRKRTFGGPGLQRLEMPWPNGSTGELISRMDQDASLGGNFYARVVGNRLRRMKPSKVAIVLGSTEGDPDDVNDLNSIVAGYLYMPNGLSQIESAITLTVPEVVHWSPIPDPAASYRGMSWVTPILKEIQADQSAQKSKQAFFDNAMTPNMVIKFPESVTTKEHFERLRDAMESTHSGAAKAFKTLYLAAGADATVVGASLKDSGLKDIQGASETRVAAAGSVPPIVAGFSEGLQAATYSNYGQARRAFADQWAFPTWRSLCTALTKVANPPSGSELWFDTGGISALREDAREAADTITTHAAAIVTLVNGGFTADSATAAVNSGDMSLLVHTNLVSVQLQPPGQIVSPPNPNSEAAT